MSLPFPANLAAAATVAAETASIIGNIKAIGFNRHGMMVLRVFQRKAHGS